MTDHDRGAYTPQNDAPLSFDARRAPSGRPVPMTLLISGMVLVILLIGVVYFYRSGVRPTGQPPQVIGAPVGALKAPPPAPKAAPAPVQLAAATPAPAPAAPVSATAKPAAKPVKPAVATPAPAA